MLCRNLTVLQENIDTRIIDGGCPFMTSDEFFRMFYPLPHSDVWIYYVKKQKKKVSIYTVTEEAKQRSFSPQLNKGVLLVYC